MSLGIYLLYFSRLFKRHIVFSEAPMIQQVLVLQLKKKAKPKLFFVDIFVPFKLNLYIHLKFHLF